MGHRTQPHSGRGAIKVWAWQAYPPYRHMDGLVFIEHSPMADVHRSMHAQVSDAPPPQLLHRSTTLRNLDLCFAEVRVDPPARVHHA